MIPQIQVIEDDKRNRAGIYQTNLKGSAPPLVTTKFTTQDQGEKYVALFFTSYILSSSALPPPPLSSSSLCVMSISVGSNILPCNKIVSHGLSQDHLSCDCHKIMDLDFVPIIPCGQAILICISLFLSSSFPIQLASCYCVSKFIYPHKMHKQS